MNKKAWRAVIGTVVILAIGVTTGIIGNRLATPPATAAKAPTTEVAPVLSPISYGPDAPSADLDGDAETFEVSHPIGSDEIVIPGDLTSEIDAAIESGAGAPPPAEAMPPSPEVLETIDALDEADDPAEVEVVDSGPADDPCEVAGSGTEADACADGLRGTILPFTKTSEPVDLPRDESRPPARVVPFGQNLIYAMAPHNPESTVVIEGGVIDPGDDTDCARVDDLVSLQPVGEPGTRAVSAGYLERNGYHNQYRKKTGQTFYAPEGATVLMCLSVFDQRRTSWDWDTASYQYSAVVQVPDVTLPRVTLESVNVHPSVTGGYLWSGASLRDGRGCGLGRAFNLESVADSVEQLGGVVLCEPYRSDGMSEYLQGDVVVTTAVVREGERLTSNAVLPLRNIRCDGGCALPPTSWYRVSLATVEHGRGLCGGGIFDSCDPPTSEISAGTATLRVDWIQGRSNGQPDWITGPLIEGTPESPASDSPRLNTRHALREVADVTGTHLAFTLETDRPVRFIASLVGEYCKHPDTVREVTGSSTDTTEIRFANLCRGSHYRAAVLLFDDEAMAGYAPGSWAAEVPDFPVMVWAGGEITTTMIERRLNISYRLADPDPARNTTLIGPFNVTIHGERVDLDVPYTNCVYGNHQAAAGLEYDAQLGDTVYIMVEASMRDGHGEVEVDGRYPQCGDADADRGERMTFYVEVPIESITASGLTITAPEGSPYEFSMTIRDWG